MLTFYATFQRYSPIKGAQISAEFQINAANFHDAALRAQLVISAMDNAEPGNDWEYRIVGIHTHDYNGQRFKGYASIWEDPPSGK